MQKKMKPGGIREREKESNIEVLIVSVYEEYSEKPQQIKAKSKVISAESRRFMKVFTTAASPRAHTKTVSEYGCM